MDTIRFEVDVGPLGLSVRQFAGSWRDDLADALNEVARRVVRTVLRDTPDGETDIIERHRPGATTYPRSLYHAKASADGVPRGKGNRARADQIYTAALRRREDQPREGWGPAAADLGLPASTTLRNGGADLAAPGDNSAEIRYGRRGFSDAVASTLDTALLSAERHLQVLLEAAFNHAARVAGLD